MLIYSTLWYCHYIFQEDIENTIQLLSVEVDRFSQKNTPDYEHKSLVEEAANMLDELKQLYAALGAR